MIILKEDNQRPTEWSLGRVIETFPGEDGFVRTAIVKTAHGDFKRPIQKLCLLPISDNENSDCSSTAQSVAGMLARAPTRK